MEPEHPIVIARLAGVFLCALPAARELYQYVGDPRCVVVRLALLYSYSTFPSASSSHSMFLLVCRTKLTFGILSLLPLCGILNALPLRVTQPPFHLNMPVNQPSDHLAIQLSSTSTRGMPTLAPFMYAKCACGLYRRAVRMGQHVWLLLATIVTELLTIVKWSKGQFPEPLPAHVKWAWTAGAGLLILYPTTRVSLERCVYSSIPSLPFVEFRKHIIIHAPANWRWAQTMVTFQVDTPHEKVDI